MFMVRCHTNHIYAYFTIYFTYFGSGWWEWVWIGWCRCRQFSRGWLEETRTLTLSLPTTSSRKPTGSCVMLSGGTLRNLGNICSGSVSLWRWHVGNDAWSAVTFFHGNAEMFLKAKLKVTVWLLCNSCWQLTLIIIYVNFVYIELFILIPVIY